MGEYLSQNYRDRLKTLLSAATTDTTHELKPRIELALALDSLGWLTETLFECVPIPAESGGQFYLGKNMVANQQYHRFLEARDFDDPALWENPYCLDCNGEPYCLSEESVGWCRSNPGDKRFPESWNDSKFGMVHRGLPVVGISWFEANAYCRWLARHWDRLEEANANPGVRPRTIRLPTEREWCRAVLGPEPDRRFPWERSSEPTRPATEEPTAEYLKAFANIGKVLEYTSPLGMFSQGVSHPYGLADACGNAWEWQANYFDRSYRALALRGGAYPTEPADAGYDLRGCRDPDGRDTDIGFRILIEV
jgi:formylglycine-generating enzyme required for sulfatase activity